MGKFPSSNSGANLFQFKEQWLLLSVGSTVRPSTQSRKGRGLHVLLWELSGNEDTIVDMGPNVPDDPQQPWLCDYHAYVNVLEQVPVGWTAIQWWGVSISVEIF
jgi:hypothetical protein